MSGGHDLYICEQAAIIARQCRLLADAINQHAPAAAARAVATIELETTALVRAYPPGEATPAITRVNGAPLIHCVEGEH